MEMGGKHTYATQVISETDELISVDQFESPIPRIIAQMTQRLTTNIYKYVTVFLDQASKSIYVYLNNQTQQ